MLWRVELSIQILHDFDPVLLFLYCVFHGDDETEDILHPFKMAPMVPYLRFLLLFCIEHDFVLDPT